MALIKVYNPPPNWPAPPTGWQPPADWRPDPDWGPAPEGWEFWREERANPRAFAYAFASAGALLVVLLAIGSVLARTLPNPEVIGEILARCAVAGLVTGIIALVTTRRWGAWLYPLVVLGVSLALVALTTAGRQSGG